MTKISQIFIFCAGRGERMRHLTNSTPKPLIEVCNKPILLHLIEKLQSLPDLERVVINAHYLPEKIIEFIARINDPRIIISREAEKLETGGGLIYAKDKIDFDKPLLTMNGDVLWLDRAEKSDIQKLCDHWNPKNHDILLGLKRPSDYVGYDGNQFGGGDFDLVGNNLFCRNGSKMGFVYVGLQIINPLILRKEEASKDFAKCFSVNKFYKSAIRKDCKLERVEGIELDGRYFHIGTPENLALAQDMLDLDS